MLVDEVNYRYELVRSFQGKVVAAQIVFIQQHELTVLAVLKTYSSAGRLVNNL